MDPKPRDLLVQVYKRLAEEASCKGCTPHDLAELAQIMLAIYREL